jgi:hypothetical protein
MPPMAAPIPMPTFAPVERPSDDELGPPEFELSGFGLTGNDEKGPLPEVDGLPLVPVAPGVAVDGVLPGAGVVAGRSVALKLSWMSGANSTKLFCSWPSMERGNVTRLKSANLPWLHCTVEKEADVTVSTHVCAYVLSVSIDDHVKPVGQHAAAVSPFSMAYSIAQPVEPPSVAMAAVVKPSGHAIPGE